jgi:hypothetical protein
MFEAGRKVSEVSRAQEHGTISVALEPKALTERSVDRGFAVARAQVVGFDDEEPGVELVAEAFGEGGI